MRSVSGIILALIAATPVAAQTTATAPPTASGPAQPSPEFRQRLEEIVPLLNGGGEYSATFAPAFVAAVPKAAFDGFNTQFATTGGKALRIKSVMPVTPWSANIVIAYERGDATAQIIVDPQGTHQVTGLRITGMSAREASLSEIDAQLAKLPGRTGFALARLDTTGPRLLTARGSDATFAIGSEFKLVILAELIRQIESGARHWTDTISLDGRPLPGGAYTAAALGTAISLYDVAEKMISVSDNSATDILLRTLGRDKVEAMLKVVGIRDPKGMQPFLGPLEVFKLKGSPLGARWGALDIKARRALLDGEIAAMPNDAIDKKLFVDGKPVLIETLEWYASPADMIRVMDWLRRHTETGPAARARALLAKNPGAGADASARWAYLGYKGGSEPGVIAMTFLGQAKDGNWYAMSASWNDPTAAVDDLRFSSLMSRAVELAAPQ
ncbi:serine hydrolase [Sphingomonas aliaeris]|uniref:Serine hydrolase n=1 Tax=Sphingomonas aliaeris TaxID=2759526 RepID=A0A974NWK8_9SPHN|nr:serine hydrolase [Sphingomonas aliaeris]QQV78127.1 serine hydrolase [Sphingomonas aliaeris]